MTWVGFFLGGGGGGWLLFLRRKVEGKIGGGCGRGECVYLGVLQLSDTHSLKKNGFDGREKDGWR